MNNFLSVHDVASIEDLIRAASAYKAQPFKDHQLGLRKRIGLIFMNPSLRTRMSTQIAARNLGLEPVVFNMDKEGWSLEFEEGAIMNGTSVEHIKDAAPVLGQYFDILCLRTFPSLKNREEDYAEHILQQFVAYAGVPVISLESATLHPLQSLADLLTIEEDMQLKAIHRPKVVLTWAPHVKALPQCVANSFAQWMNKWDQADFVITHPEGMELKEEFSRGAAIVYDQQEALQDADYIYVKNWSSYQDYGRTYDHGAQWMLSPEHLKLTREARVMHCLPVRRNVELSDAILDSKHSLVTAQAGNRVWAAQAVLSAIIRNKI